MTTGLVYMQPGITAASPEVPITENAKTLEAFSVYGFNPALSSGLEFHYFGGRYAGTAIASDSLTLTAGGGSPDTWNYIVQNRSTKALSVSTTTTNWNDTASYARVYSARTSTTAIEELLDYRVGSNGVFDVGSGSGDVVGPGSSTTGHIPKFADTSGKVLADGYELDTDGTLAANSDTKVASQKATKTYVDSIVTGGASDVMIFKGVIDCSSNPNYPAADAGHLYKISVAGKIGGASGAVVEAGDTIYCITDGTSAGTQAGVGANWVITQLNIDGAVTGPASVTSSNLALFDGTSGKVIKQSTFTAVLDTISSTQGAVLYRGASTWAALGAGNAGQRLKSNGSSANPAWVDEPVTLPVTKSGSPTSSEKLFDFICTFDMVIPSSLSGSSVKADVAATAQTDFALKDDGSTVATIRFAASGTTASFVSVSAGTIAAGSRVTFEAPGSADATLAGLYGGIHLLRN